MVEDSRIEDSLQQAAGNALAVAVQRSRDLNGLRAERVFIAFGASLILAKMMLYSAVKIRYGNGFFL